MAIGNISNGEVGLTVRGKLNEVIDAVNAGGGAELLGTLRVHNTPTSYYSYGLGLGSVGSYPAKLGMWGPAVVGSFPEWSTGPAGAVLTIPETAEYLFIIPAIEINENMGAVGGQFGVAITIDAVVYALVPNHGAENNQGHAFAVVIPLTVGDSVRIGTYAVASIGSTSVHNSQINHRGQNINGGTALPEAFIRIFKLL